ncbi:rRNA pseudouridine synthase [Planctomycetales bacterium ZRK34]|nr:rRNA pseudouridine synthase [Planctomycetales bacterium ZRK34]
MPRRPRSSNTPRTTKADLQDASRGLRLHKALADAGVGSRRTCEAMIDEGRVAVNGLTINFKPVWVDPRKDHITVDGRAVNAPSDTGKSTQPGHTYLMLNKSRGVICTSDDPQHRKTVLDMLPHEQRLFCVGRLDAESTGLVLMTDDGELANRLTHPRYEVPKTYQVAIAGSLTDEDVAKLTEGIYLADRGKSQAVKAHATEVKFESRDRERTRLLITLREGRNREIRRMLARLGYKVKRLKRVGLGPLRLKGVATGQWRPLTRIEVATLRQTARTADKPRKKK